MKFGKLFADAMLACRQSDWPVGVRFKMLKKELKQRCKECRTREATNLFMKWLREDVRGLNSFWTAKEAEILAARALTCGEDARAGGPSAARGHLDGACDLHRGLLQYLILNYLAVIKIAKKHDKAAGTKLLMPVCRVLLTQAFVKGFTTSSVFSFRSHDRDPAPADEHAKRLIELIGEILGSVPGAASYLPSTLAARVHACGLLSNGIDERSSSATSDACSGSSTDDELDDADEWMALARVRRRRRGGGRDPKFVIRDAIPEDAVLDTASGTFKVVANAVAVLIVALYLHFVWQRSPSSFVVPFPGR